MVLDWGRNSENTLLFEKRREKYMLFRNPKNFLIDMSTVDGEPDHELAEKSKEIILQEYFTKEVSMAKSLPLQKIEMLYPLTERKMICFS